MSSLYCILCLMFCCDTFFLCILLVVQLECVTSKFYVPVRHSVLCDSNKVVGVISKRENCRPQKCSWNEWYQKHYEQPDTSPARIVLRYVTKVQYHYLKNCHHNRGHWTLKFWHNLSINIWFIFPSFVAMVIMGLGIKYINIILLKWLQSKLILLSMLPKFLHIITQLGPVI